MPDEIQKCRAVLQSMLPRESMSKETDAALFTGMYSFTMHELFIELQSCYIEIEQGPFY